MRYALISDVHANLPALEAVLEDVDRAGVDAGPERREALDSGQIEGEL